MNYNPKTQRHCPICEQNVTSWHIIPMTITIGRFGKTIDAPVCGDCEQKWYAGEGEE